MQHFIRCIKPNEAAAPFAFEPRTVRLQLLNCSVRAAADVSRAGYPYRASFFDMLDQFDEMMTPAERKSEALLDATPRRATRVAPPPWLGRRAPFATPQPWDQCAACVPRAA